MKLSIIPEDKTVYKDGVSYSNLEWEDTPPDVHALQWTSSNTGWIEYSTDRFGNKLPNLQISELPQWAQNALDAWETANDLANAAPISE